MVSKKNKKSFSGRSNPKAIPGKKKTGRLEAFNHFFYCVLTMNTVLCFTPPPIIIIFLFQVYPVPSFIFWRSRILIFKLLKHLSYIPYFINEVLHVQQNSTDITFFVNVLIFTLLNIKVMDPSPIPGMKVTPLHGVVPVGGTTAITISATPNAIMKFDTHVDVSIRGYKTLELRMGGTVESPVVDIELVGYFSYFFLFCGKLSSLELLII